MPPRWPAKQWFALLCRCTIAAARQPFKRVNTAAEGNCVDVSPTWSVAARGNVCLDRQSGADTAQWNMPPHPPLRRGPRRPGAAASQSAGCPPGRPCCAGEPTAGGSVAVALRCSARAGPTSFVEQLPKFQSKLRELESSHFRKLTNFETIRHSHKGLRCRLGDYTAAAA